MTCTKSIALQNYWLNNFYSQLKCCGFWWLYTTGVGWPAATRALANEVCMQLGSEAWLRSHARNVSASSLTTLSRKFMDFLLLRLLCFCARRPSSAESSTRYSARRFSYLAPCMKFGNTLWALITVQKYYKSTCIKRNLIKSMFNNKKFLNLLSDLNFLYKF